VHLVELRRLQDESSGCSAAGVVHRRLTDAAYRNVCALNDEELGEAFQTLV